MVAVLGSLILVACKHDHGSSDVKEQWSFTNDPALIAIDPTNLGYLDTSVDDDGAVYKPELLRSYYESHFAKLPLAGHLATIPWASTYWPSKVGGIAAFWNLTADEEKELRGSNAMAAHPLTFKKFTEAEIRSMSLAQLARLSPAHKYEIYAGNFDFLSVNWERQRTSIETNDWEGLCDGWASAALNFAAPKPVVLRGKTGIMVPFGASDIEALLIYYQSKIYRDNKKTRAKASTWRKVAAGQRCREDLKKFPERAVSPECKGINAGSFHIILANRIGLNQQGVVIDVTRGEEVWNQPVYGYSSKTVKKDAPIYNTAAPNTAQIIEQETVLEYVQESEAHWDNLGAKNADYLVKITYRYNLELDAQGNIIGGEWISWDRPDYMSHRLRPPTFDGGIGHWTLIPEIYEQSLKVEGPVPNPVSE
jgi:hypothetical protein